MAYTFSASAERREMGKKNNVLNVYMNQPERIQSLLEYYTREKLPEEWAAACKDEATFFAVENEENRMSHRQRDIFKKIEVAEGIYYLGIENQEKINLIFPWRQMQMDCLAYERQIRQIQQENEDESAAYGKEDDYLYRYKSDDRVVPVINLVLYWGKKPWKTPQGISDMSNIKVLPRGMTKLAEDYRIHLIPMREIPNEALKTMKSDLKYILGLMKCGTSRREYEEFILRNREYFSHIPKSAVDVLRVCMNIKEVTKILEYHTTEAGEEETDMCRALEELKKEAMEKGIEQERRLHIVNIMKNLKMTAQQAMELLGIPVSEQGKYLELN